MLNARLSALVSGFSIDESGGVAFHAPSGNPLTAMARSAFRDSAKLVANAYRGNIDSQINDQYRSPAGARRFLSNIVEFPGCGVFFPAAPMRPSSASGALRHVAGEPGAHVTPGTSRSFASRLHIAMPAWEPYAAAILPRVRRARLPIRQPDRDRRERRRTALVRGWASSAAAISRRTCGIPLALPKSHASAWGGSYGEK